jgi:hypothetical protein
LSSSCRQNPRCLLPPLRAPCSLSLSLILFPEADRAPAASTTMARQLRLPSSSSLLASRRAGWACTAS